MKIFRRATTFLCPLLLAFLSIFFSLSKAHSDTSSPELILRVKPSLCLRYSADENCKLSVEVIWKDSSPSNYCLHSIQNEAPVRCWEDSTGASIEEDREISEDLIYWLARPGEPGKLVTATVEMATIVEDEKRSRTRRRHIWNLI